MSGDDQQQIEIPISPVNRARRFAYIASVTVYCLLIPTVMAFLKLDGKIAELVSEGLIGLAEVLVISYVAASVTDHSGVLNSVAQVIAARRGRRLPEDR